MNFIKDIIFVNSTVFKKALKSFSKNWIIFLSGFVYILLNIVVFTLINLVFRGVLGIIGGFIAALVSSSFISNYLYLLFNIVKYDKITFQNFKDGFKVFIWKVYGIFFIGWLARFLLDNIGVTLGSGSYYKLNVIINILILVIFNPLPEIIYQKYYSPWESIVHCFEFMKENWVNWLLPNTLFLLIIYKLTGVLISDVFVTYLSFNLNFSLMNIILYVVGQVLFSFIMIYRGFLFEMLSTSTRRKRNYMKKFYE